MRKKKLIAFHPALAPYRIDQFNKLSELFDLKIIFLNKNVPNQHFDQDFLLGQLKCRYGFLLKGFNLKGRYIRTGIKKEIELFKPDIIMGYEYSLTTVYLLLLNKFCKLNAKIISMVDDNVEICKFPGSKIRRWLRGWSLKRLDYLVLLSKEVGEWYISNKNIDEKKLIISPIVYNPQKFISEKSNLLNIAENYIQKYNFKNRKVLLFVGRIAKEKGLGYLLNIMPSLILKDKSLLLVLIGDGPETNNVMDLINDKRLNSHVLMPGRFEKSELYAWYLCANIFILPSIYEPFGAVVNESLLFGTAVICSKYAGAASLIIEYENGIIVDPTEEITFVDAVIDFLQRKKSLINNSPASKQNLMPYDFDYYFNDWYKLT